jgi:hypothetical protein
MEQRLIWLAFAVGLGLVSVVGCANPPREEQLIRESFKMTPMDDLTNPNVVRFDVWGDPYEPASPDSAESRLPPGDRVLSGMRRYAAIKLKELGFCPHGFVGPERVLAYPQTRMQSFFYVRCLSPPR